MEDIYKRHSLDIKGLCWGIPPVPLLPETLRELWKDEALPSWLVTECHLPSKATITTLGPLFWNSQNCVPRRVQHFVEFLIKSRARSIKDLRCIKHPWPVGLELNDIPFSARSAHALGASSLSENKEALAELTFGQLLLVPRLGVKSLLEITTLIDAALYLHWRMTTELAKSFATFALEQEPTTLLESEHPYTTAMHIAPSADLVPNDMQWSAQLSDALVEPWVDQLDEHDARFKHVLPPGYGTVEERIEQAISDPASASVDTPALIESLPRIRAAVERLNSLSLEESLLELLAVYLGKQQPRLDAIAARLGWLGDEPKTLQECGDVLGVTRERIRQIEKNIHRLINRPLYLPQLDAGLALLEASAPCHIGHAAQLLVERGICHRPFSPISLLSTAQLLGRKTTLTIEAHKGERIVVSGEHGETLGLLARTARTLTGQSGVASVYQVVDAIKALLMPREPAHINEDYVRQILRLQDGCEFLDEDWFWFTGIPEGRNRLENLMKKILSVASPQSISCIREGVRRAFLWRSLTNERYHSLTVPPQSVLVRFLERHPDFHLNENSVISVKQLDYRKVLGKGEQVLVDVLRSVSSGVVDRRTLVRECLSRGINESTLGVYTSYSPILEHTGTDLWQLRGVHVDPAAVEAVREQNSSRPRECTSCAPPTASAPAPS